MHGSILASAYPAWHLPTDGTQHPRPSLYISTGAPYRAASRSPTIIGSFAIHMSANFVLRRRLTCGIAAVCFSTGALAAFPEKPIRMIVISSAGGSTDMVARATGRALGEGLGQTVVLDNRPGGGGLIASDLTAKSRPDGYTILMANTSHAVQPSLHAKLPYDPLRDFAPVSLVALTHSLLLVHPSLPVKTTRELIDYAKANPGKLNYASGTNGSSAHIGSELLKLMAGMDIVRVPYKGTAENLNALIANEVQVSFVTMPAALPLINSGRLRVLALGGPRRATRLPDVPTVAETLPGYDIGTWHGVLAPAGTPPAIVARMSAELAKMAKNPEAREQAAAQGLELVGSTPQELDTYIRTQITKFAKMVKATGMRVD
jgi:tripartite-type tricarboxylate transporter receptor subunit TctC